MKKKLLIGIFLIAAALTLFAAFKAFREINRGVNRYGEAESEFDRHSPAIADSGTTYHEATGKWPTDTDQLHLSFAPSHSLLLTPNDPEHWALLLVNTHGEIVFFKQGGGAGIRGDYVKPLSAP